MFIVQVVPLFTGTETTMSPSRHCTRLWISGSIQPGPLAPSGGAGFPPSVFVSRGFASARFDATARVRADFGSTGFALAFEFTRGMARDYRVRARFCLLGRRLFLSGTRAPAN